MIADSVGVTKAAVYHQFKTKEAIVVALVDMELGQLQLALDAAQEGRGGPDELVALMTQVIDLAVSRRRMVRTLLYDPVIVRLLAEHRPYQVFMRRLFGALLGGATDPKARVRAAMVASAIGGVVTHPLVAALDDSTLRAELIDLAQRLM
jgi:AcrR family transcriptional regulator